MAQRVKLSLPIGRKKRAASWFPVTVVIEKESDASEETAERWSSSVNSEIII